MPATTCLSGRCTRYFSGATIKLAARVAAASALALSLLGVQAGAAEISLLSAAAMQSVLPETVADFERGSPGTPVQPAEPVAAFTAFLQSHRCATSSEPRGCNPALAATDSAHPLIAGVRT